MRITKIELENFRAFYNNYVIDLGKDGKNLLVYGENGSGKNSISTSIIERQSLLKASDDIEIH